MRNGLLLTFSLLSIIFLTSCSTSPKNEQVVTGTAVINLIRYPLYLILITY